jgi:hypothetical protein
VTQGRTTEQWEYIKVTTGKVPGLMEDGVHIDPINQHDVNFLIYPDGKSTVGSTTLWGHRKNNRELIHARSNLEREGVANLDRIIRELSTKGFLLAEYSGRAFRPEEVSWTNTLFLHSSDKPRVLNFERMKRISEQVLRSLPLDSDSLDGSSRMLIASVRNPNNEEMLIIFDLNRSKAQRKLIGEVHTITNDPVAHTKIITQRLRSLGAHGRVYLYGDDLKSIDVSRIADSVGCDLVRRSVTTVKDFRATDTRLDSISERSLEPSTTALVHGTPSTESELENMGFPSASLPGWQRIREQMETHLEGRIGRRINTKEDLIQELSAGNSDVLFVIAHSDGRSFYLSGQKVAIAEIENLQPRTRTTNRPRIAVLISCYAGQFPNPNRRWQFFQKEVKSLAEVLVNKGFFDEVLAPNKEITGDEGLGILDTAIREFSTSLGRKIRGLLKIAGITRNKPEVVF